MIPGSIYYHNAFLFHDGEVSQKFFIVLGGISPTRFVVAKTTSKKHGRPAEYGCHTQHPRPSFYLPIGTSNHFKVPTWVCLNEYYELDADQLLSDGMSGVVRHAGSLDNNALWDLAECAINSDDITQAQAEAIMQSVGIPF